MAEKVRCPASRWPGSISAGASGLTYVSRSRSSRFKDDISFSSIATLQAAVNMLDQSLSCCTPQSLCPELERDKQLTNLIFLLEILEFPKPHKAVMRTVKPCRSQGCILSLPPHDTSCCMSCSLYMLHRQYHSKMQCADIGRAPASPRVLLFLLGRTAAGALKEAIQVLGLHRAECPRKLCLAFLHMARLAAWLRIFPISHPTWLRCLTLARLRAAQSLCFGLVILQKHRTTASRRRWGTQHCEFSGLLCITV